MRWFKHLSIAHDDDALCELLEEFGAAGYGVWWIILELIAGQMDKTDKCFAKFSVKKWAKTCQVSVKKLHKMVSFLSEVGKFSIEYCGESDKFLIIECPNLLKFRDEYTKKSGHRPERVRSKSGVAPSSETEAETRIQKLETETKPKYLENSDEFRLAKFLYQNILKNKPDFKKQNLQKWAEDADRMLRLDKRDLEKVKKVIVWAHNDDFERGVLLSMAKVRKRFDSLEIKMNTKGGGGYKKKAVKKERTMAEIRAATTYHEDGTVTVDD